MVTAQEWEPDHDLRVMKEWLQIISFTLVELLTVVMCLYRVAKLRMCANGLKDFVLKQKKASTVHC